MSETAQHHNSCKQCGTVNKAAAAFCAKCGYPLEHEALDLEGQRVGNYQLINRIGGGGFGEVYRSEHAELRNPFAVKILHPKLAADPQFVDRFRHEAMVLAGLQHENVVQVVDFGQRDDLGFYLVMEWLEGQTLHRHWRRKRVLPLGQIYALFSQLLDALQVAHSRGVVHRDMKPENLMLTRGSRGRTILKIVDFGIATIIQGDGQDKDPTKQKGMAVGTPYYMSPEQAAGRTDLVDQRTDLYACGVIFAELLTGKRLFKTKDPRQILRHQLETQPPTLEQLNPSREYPFSFQLILERALAKDLNHRYASASEFYDDLAVAMEEAGVQAQEEEVFSSTPSSGSHGGLLAMALGQSADDLESPSTGGRFRGQKASGQLPPPLSLDDLPQAQAQTGLPSWFRWAGIAAFACLLLLVARWYNKTTPTPRPTTRAGSSVFQAPRPTPPVGARPRSRQLETRGQDAPQPRNTKPAQRALAVEARPQTPRKTSTARKKRRRRKRRWARRKRRSPRQRLRVRPKPRSDKRIVRAAPPKPRVVKKTFQLRVVTKPAGAMVFINGRARGQTPYTVKVTEGTSARIQVRKKSYVSQSFRWKATHNQRRSLTLIEKLF